MCLSDSEDDDAYVHWKPTIRRQELDQEKATMLSVPTNQTSRGTRRPNATAHAGGIGAQHLCALRGPGNLGC
jgi:hypothetical protein